MYKQVVARLSAGLLVTSLAVSQTTIGTITLQEPVLADGKVLVAGTYQVRSTSLEPRAALGQSTASERWVEFVKGREIAGREIASVVPDAEIGAIAEGTRPKPNTSRIDLLKGGDYLRVWINHDGLNYLIHMPPAREAERNVPR